VRRYAIEADPTDFNSYYQYADFLKFLNKKEEAIHYLLKALECNPTNMDSLSMMRLLVANKPNTLKVVQKELHKTYQ